MVAALAAKVEVKDQRAARSELRRGPVIALEPYAQGLAVLALHIFISGLKAI